MPLFALAMFVAKLKILKRLSNGIPWQKELLAVSIPDKI